MGNGALMAIIAWQLVLTESVRNIRVGENPHSLSNIHLVMPLMVSDMNHVSDASDESDEHMPFSNIPSSAFTLDESLPAPSHKPKLSLKESVAYRPRSIYLESLENDERSEQSELDERSERSELDAALWRVCSRLGRAPAGLEHELLLVLCNELLDGPPPHGPGCPCCQQSAAPVWWEPLMTTGRNNNWKPLQSQWH